VGFWAIIFILITVLALERGAVDMIFFFGIPAAWFTYMWATKDERAKKKREQNWERQQQKKAQEHTEMQRRAMSRFQNSSFASQVIREIRGRSHMDLDYQKGGCQVMHDKIVTPYWTYVYDDYGLGKLDDKGIQELAEFLGMALGNASAVDPITKFVGGMSNSYTVSENSSGGYSVTRDGWGGDKLVGYKVYNPNTRPAPKPKGRDW